jgi:hypothetical protein
MRESAASAASDENDKFQAKSYMTRIAGSTCEGSKVGSAKLLGTYLEVYLTLKFHLKIYEFCRYSDNNEVGFFLIISPCHIGLNASYYLYICVDIRLSLPFLTLI